jgi:glyoxylase-like metal-dependent hydrolase (beta-lactamase superfamily II)
LRAVSLTESALLITSAFWQTNAVALRAGGEAVLVDSPYLPDELDALPSVLAGAGCEPDGLIATHGDFDHLLGRVAYPGMALGVAESTALRFRAAPGEAQRHLRHYDEEFYIERAAPLSLGQVQSLPVPGRLDLGNGPDAIEIELHAAEGHTTDGMALFARPLGVLVVGDYVSSVEIPWIHGSLPDYRSTLRRLRPLVEAADVIVPGHGPAHTSATALRLIDEDEAYLDSLEAGEEKPPLPSGRDSHAQRQIHRENLEKVGAA